MNEVTRILSAIEQGDPHAAQQLLPLVYDELRQLAARRLAQEKPGLTLQATALVHEAWKNRVGNVQTPGNSGGNTDFAPARNASGANHELARARIPAGQRCLAQGGVIEEDIRTGRIGL